MQWRYATKMFDSTKKLDKEIMYALLEILRLTPTTLGLQLWRFVVVTDMDIRKKLVEQCRRMHGGHQEHNMLSCSHVLVFARPARFEDALIDQHIEHVAYVRNQTINELHAYAQNLHHWADQPQVKLDAWMDNQVFLALGAFIAACASARIDTCPVENFDQDKFDEILGIQHKGLHSVVACSIGVRSPTDKYVKEKKVRYPVEDLLIER